MSHKLYAIKGIHSSAQVEESELYACEINTTIKIKIISITPRLSPYRNLSLYLCFK